MGYNRGDIVWVKFPFTDSAASKIRPALIISNHTINSSGDYLLMQVTSRIRNDELSLSISNSDYVANPLLIQSQLRLHKIFILNEALIIRKASSVNDTYENCNQAILTIDRNRFQNNKAFSPNARTF